MNAIHLENTLQQLIACWENETVEFKSTYADDKSASDEIGKYTSALANEAALRQREYGWLVVGVCNKTRSVVGTNFKQTPDALKKLRHQLSQSTQPRLAPHHIYEYHHPQGRILLFQIPAAPQGQFIAWQGFAYGRNGESLAALSLDKQDKLRGPSLPDWSAQIVPTATLNDLDPQALEKAKEGFAQKNPRVFESIHNWSWATFLDRARITQEGKMTRTALLLLGKPESSYHLSPHPAQISWSLQGPERAYQHFGPPFLLNTTALYQKIRNVQLRLLPEGELIPFEIAKYDQKMVLEALHNCVAHQDYTRSGRIVVTEKPDRLIFENEGGFFEGNPLDYLHDQKTPRRYRNTFLIEAMVALNMNDKMGYGIYEMHKAQIQRHLPLPDYDLSDPNAVKLTLYGGEVDPCYTQTLMRNSHLSMEEILALDRVQKKQSIQDNMAKRLKDKGLIEGRKPNYHVSATVAKTVNAGKADYIHTRGQDDDYYAKLLTDYLEKFGQANRQDINHLLLSKLSSILNDSQKSKKISNLLTKWKNQGLIINQGSDRDPSWILVDIKK